MSRTISVELGDRSYDVTVAGGSIDSLGQALGQLVPGRRAFVITDSNVGPLYADRLVASLSGAGFNADVTSFPAGEPNKTLATVSDLFGRIIPADPPPDRQSVIVALGGGVVGDVAGFVAATLLRGVAYVQVPTSLLADVDSSVGGKTGVDHPAGKNLIGAFHQPRAVWIDPQTLTTLAPVELSSGLAECVKHGVIRDASLIATIENQAEALLNCEVEALADLIARNVAIKAAVVSADERESGQRAHLNFGHTIGHAIEAKVGFAVAGDYLRHGHCVALGMVAANHIAVQRDLLDAADAERVKALLQGLNLPTRLDGLDGRELLTIMRRDKKARAGKIRFVLADRLGQVDLYDDVNEDEILSAVAALAG